MASMHSDRKSAMVLSSTNKLSGSTQAAFLLCTFSGIAFGFMVCIHLTLCLHGKCVTCYYTLYGRYVCTVLEALLEAPGHRTPS